MGLYVFCFCLFFFFQAEDGIRDLTVTGVQTCALPISTLMYGEQGAMLACSQLVDVVEGADHKFFQATQVMDEARHNEVLDRYITDRKSTRLNSSHSQISYAVFCLKKKKTNQHTTLAHIV